MFFPLAISSTKQQIIIGQKDTQSYYRLQLCSQINHDKIEFHVKLVISIFLEGLPYFYGSVYGGVKEKHEHQPKVEFVFLQLNLCSYKNPDQVSKLYTNFVCVLYGNVNVKNL